MRLSEWAIDPHNLLDADGTLSFGGADGHATDAVLACALLGADGGERAQWVGSIDLQAIGSALERTGLAAVTELVGSGHLTSLHTLCLRDASWISKQLLLALLRAVRPRAHAWCTPTPCPTPPSVHC